MVISKIDKTQYDESIRLWTTLFSEAMFQDMLLPSSGPNTIEASIETYLYQTLQVIINQLYYERLTKTNTFMQITFQY